MTLLTINTELCGREGNCIASCPRSLILRGPGGFPVERDGAADQCIRCGQCMSVCTPGALTNHHFDGQEFVEYSSLDKAADPVSYAMLTRRSVRAFLNRPVDKQELKALFDVVRHAPSTNNTQRLWWIVTSDPESTRAVGKVALNWLHETYYKDCSNEACGIDEDPILRNAPHLALCCAPEGYKGAATDCAIAMTHLDLLASSRGLGTCWAGVFLQALEAWPPLAEAVGLPPGQKVFGALVLGHPRFAHGRVPPRKPLAVDWR